MAECDFSCFDGVLSPVIAVSADLQPLYANRVALHSYPLLSSRGPALYYTDQTLSSVRERVPLGQVFMLSVDAEVRGVIVFEPVLCPDGSVSHVFLHVADNASALDRLMPVGDELLSDIQENFAEPLCNALSMLEDLSRRIPADLRPFTHGIRKHLLNGASLFGRLVEPCLGEPHGIRICDADALLQLCSEWVPAVQYTSDGPCYIPMQRDMALHLFVDVFSCALLYTKRKERFCVVLTRKEHENVFSFSVPLSPGMLLSEEVGKKIGESIFAVNHRLSSMGGRCCIEDSEDGRMVVRIAFPEICFSSSQVTLGSPFDDGLSSAVRLSLEYLRALAESEE